MKPELLDGAQSGFDGLPPPIISVPQRPRRILEVNDTDALHFHISNIVIHSTIFKCQVLDSIEGSGYCSMGAWPAKAPGIAGGIEHLIRVTSARTPADGQLAFFTRFDRRSIRQP